jgi:hypothetical protein
MMSGIAAGIVPHKCSKCKGKGFVIADILAGSTKKCPQCTVEPVIIAPAAPTGIAPISSLPVQESPFRRDHWINQTTYPEAGRVCDPGKPCKCGNTTFITFRGTRLEECTMCGVQRG